MSAIRLKVPDDLKRGIARLAASTGQTPHAFMVDALAREAERSELRRRFAAEAADSEREALGTGKAHSLDAGFDYHAARISGKNPRRPGCARSASNDSSRPTIHHTRDKADLTVLVEKRIAREPDS